MLLGICQTECPNPLAVKTVVPHLEGPAPPRSRCQPWMGLLEAGQEPSQPGKVFNAEGCIFSQEGKIIKSFLSYKSEA